MFSVGEQHLLNKIEKNIQSINNYIKINRNRGFLSNNFDIVNNNNKLIRYREAHAQFLNLKKLSIKLDEIVYKLNNNNYNLNDLNINTFDKADWENNTKNEMSFLENFQLTNYNENEKYEYDFSNDIIVFASYPSDHAFVYMIKKFLSLGIKKIYFMYSDTDLTHKNFTNLSIFESDKVSAIKVNNIGYDFKKYYEGMKLIKENGDNFNKVWLMNDSFIITKWNFLNYNLIREEKNDITGAFLSFQRKKHLQSYLLIMNSSIFDEYYNFLKSYTFIEIKTIEEKNKLIDDLEVGLCNTIINKNIKYGSIFKVKEASNQKKNIPVNPTVNYGCYCGIIKKGLIEYKIPWKKALYTTLLSALNSNELLLIIAYYMKNNIDFKIKSSVEKEINETELLFK